MAAGLVYAGQAGATTGPTGVRPTSTLRSRIGGNHLGGRISASTWRKTLAASLARPLRLEVVRGELTPPSHRVLTQWMGVHLRLTVHPVPHRDALGALEHAVLARLDPALNLAGMPRTSLRTQLSALRAALEADSTTENGRT